MLWLLTPVLSKCRMDFAIITALTNAQSVMSFVSSCCQNCVRSGLVQFPSLYTNMLYRLHRMCVYTF